MGVATLLADRFIAVDSVVVAQTGALKGFIDTTTELTAHPPLANGAVRPTPSRMTPGIVMTQCKTYYYKFEKHIFKIISLYLSIKSRGITV